MPSFITVSMASGDADAFVQRVDRLVDHRHQHAIGNEAGKIAHFDRRLAQIAAPVCRLRRTFLARSRFRE